MLATLSQVLSTLGITPGTVPSLEGPMAFLLNQADRQVKDFVGNNVEQADYTEYYPEVSSNVLVDDDMLVTGYELMNGKAVPFSRGDNARTVLQLIQKPVRAITAVYENPGAWSTPGGSWDPILDKLDPSAWQLDMDQAGISWTGQLLRRQGAWTTARRAVKVVYTAGLTAGELDPLTGPYPQYTSAVIDTVIAWVTKSAILRKAMMAGGILAGESMDGWSNTYMPLAAAGLQSLVSNGLPTAAKQKLESQINIRRYI